MRAFLLILALLTTTNRAAPATQPTTKAVELKLLPGNLPQATDHMLSLLTSQRWTCSDPRNILGAGHDTILEFTANSANDITVTRTIHPIAGWGRPVGKPPLRDRVDRFVA